VYYHLHGGGYVMGSGSPKSLAANIPRGVLEECAGIVDRAFCVDFRIASAAPYTATNPFPAPLVDALSGYQYLIKTIGFSPRDIIVGGDSSGGHLAADLVRYLALEKIPTLPSPRALLLLSPTMDWGCTHDNGTPSSSMESNSKSDFVRIILHSGYSAQSLRGSLDPDEILYNSWLSPASLKIVNPSGLFNGYPHTCIISGGAEQTVDAMRTFRDRLIRDNDEKIVKYSEYPNAVHDFILLTWHEPERSAALKEIRGWLNEILKE